ncbi:MAG: glutamyl-tRNA reductase, partial [Hymenobacter sp.]
MQYPFQALSLSYKTAPLAIREQLALDEAASAQLLRRLHHELGLAEVLVLSTCNRTEVYYSAPAPAQNQSAAVLAVLGQLTGVPDMARYAPYFTSYPTAQAAAQHLFEVALGLDAQVVGDAQIIHQV